MSGRLDGKVIVIVGGTTGLGLSAARACIAAGARVVVVGRDAQHADDAETSLGESARAVVGDAVAPETATRAIHLATQQFGGFDGLYHVAGGSGRRSGDGPLGDISDEGWQKTIQLNLTSLFHSNRAAIQQFLQQGTGGSVLNMSSVLADSPSPRYFATHAYTATKAAAVGLTTAAAAYYAKQDIRFNVIAPSLIDTPLTERATSDAVIMQYVETKQPLDGGRIGTPEDVNSAVVYFLSDESKFVTGQVLKVDGGWSVTEGQYGGQ